MSLLGRITVPSGVLVIGDMGYLGDWSGEAEPGVPLGVSAEIAEIAATARDWRVAGRDAEAAAAALGLQPLTYVYDFPDGQQLRERFADALAGTDHAAELVQEDRRIPHRERAARAAAAGGSDFIIHGVPFVALPVPAGRPLDVVGRRSSSDPHAWRWVEIVVSGEPAATTRRLGDVGVDWARLVLADADALSAWVHEEPLDGLADVAFWGRDVEQAASRFTADRLDEQGVYGWESLPMEQAVDRAVAVEDWKTEEQRGLAVDLRPHSHHYHVMRQVRASDTESGVLEVGGAQLLGFMTTWGDGMFDVELDEAAGGDPVAVRVVFADD